VQIIISYNYWRANLERSTEINYYYSEDGSLLERSEIETKYDRKEIKSEQYICHKYEWSVDGSICIESIFKDNELYQQYERTYDLNGNILVEKYVFGYSAGSYTEYKYEWLPDYFNRIKDIKKK
jgi:hypothetical protein